MNDGAVEHGISSVRGEGYVARCQLSALSRSVSVTAEREEEDRGGGGRRRRPYTVRQRIDPMAVYDDEKFVQRFRLSKRSVTYVVNLIEPSPMWPPPSRAVRLMYYDTSACNYNTHRRGHNTLLGTQQMHRL